MTRLYLATENIPKIYAFSIDGIKFQGKLKIGMTSREDASKRVKEQVKPIMDVDQSVMKIQLVEDAVKDNGDYFTDYDVRNLLIKKASKSAGESESLAPLTMLTQQ